MNGKTILIFNLLFALLVNAAYADISDVPTKQSIQRILASDKLVILDWNKRTYAYDTLYYSSKILPGEFSADLLELEVASDSGIILGNPQYILRFSHEKRFVEQIDWYYNELFFQNERRIITLKKPEVISDFLRKHNARYIDSQIREAKIRKTKWVDAWDRWKKNVPSPLAPYWTDEFKGAMLFGKSEGLYHRLQESALTRDAQIRGLIRWFGAGEGSWNGYPYYETIAEELLLRYTIDEIGGAVVGRELSTQQIIGLARFISSSTVFEEKAYVFHRMPKSILGVVDNAFAIIEDRENQMFLRRAVERIEETKRDWRLWNGAVPVAFRSIYAADYASETDRIDTTLYWEKMRNEIRNEKEMIRSLLSWNGSYMGCWGDAPKYVALPDKLLGILGLNAVVAAAKEKPLSMQEKRGLQKFFGTFQDLSVKVNEAELLELRRIGESIELKCNEEVFLGRMSAFEQ